MFIQLFLYTRKSTDSFWLLELQTQEVDNPDAQP